VRRHCSPCGRTMELCEFGLRVHKGTTKHLRRAVRDGLSCEDGAESFLSRREFDEHAVAFHAPETLYRCLECALDFATECALNAHVGNEWVHRERVASFACVPCGLAFASEPLLGDHLRSKEHKPVRCAGSSLCSRRFAIPAAMLAHLESGACVSGLDRQSIAAKLRQHDGANLLVKRGVPETTARADLAERSAARSAAGTVREVNDDSDSDSDGGGSVIPAGLLSSRDSTSSWSAAGFSALTPNSDADDDDDEAGTLIMTPDTRTDSGLLTPSGTDASYSQHEDMVVAHRICPLCTRRFAHENALEQHLASVAHAPAIYHCPASLFGGQADHARAKQREFKSLESLIRHLMGRNCDGFKDKRGKAIAYVEELFGRMVAGKSVRLLSG